MYENQDKSVNVFEKNNIFAFDKLAETMQAAEYMNIAKYKIN